MKRQSIRAGLLLALAATNSNVVVVTAQTSTRSCPICVGGGDLYRPDEQICKDISRRTSGLFETDTDCLNLQLEAYQIGCCPMPPYDHCEYCADGSPFNPDMIIPSGKYVDGETCFDYSYQAPSLLGLFEDGSCDDTFLRRAGQYCGCPNQVQECWLCPDRQPPANLGKGEDWVTGSNCRGIEYLFSLFHADECSSFPMDAGADLAIFCGCGGLNETEIEEQKEIFQCELCRNGGFVLDPTMIYTDGSSAFSKTCQQADDFARDIIKTPWGCNNPNYFSTAREVCCSNGGTSGARPASTVTVLVASLVVSQVVAMAMAWLF